MKVLIIHTIYKIKGGEEVVVQNESQLLIANGVEVKNLYFTNPTDVFSSIISFIQLPFNIASYKRVKKIIKEFSPDIIHLHNWNYAGSPSIIIAASRARVPLVYSIHNYRLLCPSGTLSYNGELFLQSLKENFPWTAIKKKVYRNSALLTFWLSLTVYVHKKLGTWSSVSMYFVLTEAQKKLFLDSQLKLSQMQVAVKPNSAPDAGLASNRNNKKLVYVGRLNKEKGILILIEAISKTNFELNIIGDGPLRALVEAKASTLKNITYKGPLAHSKAIEEIKAASALILPSLWFEGMPMNILEAFSAGTPVIASYIGAMKEVVIDGYNGFHFEAGNAVDLIDKLHKWNELDKEDQQQICLNARKSYEQNFSEEINLRRLLSLYQKVSNLKNSKLVYNEPVLINN